MDGGGVGPQHAVQFVVMTPRPNEDERPEYDLQQTDRYQKAERIHLRVASQQGPGDHRGNGGALPCKSSPFMLEARIEDSFRSFHRTSTTKNTAEATPTTATPTVMSCGNRDGGSGLSRRIARSLNAHRRYAVADVRKLSTSSMIPSTSEPENSSRIVNAPSPPAISASAVRIQAKRVRSLARLNR
jgi:hypothetical protein